MGENGCRFCMATGNPEASNGLVRSQFQIPQQDFSISISICSIIQYLSQYLKKNLERQKKFYTENKRAVAGVGTAVLGFSAISCFAFNFGKNNLGWGRKKTRDVSDSNIQGDRTALDYKLK